MERACVDGDGLARFEPDIAQIVALACLLNERNESFAVVVCFGDPVAAAEVHPLDLSLAKEGRELGVNGIERGSKGIGTLLAECVKVDACDAFEQVSGCVVELFRGDAEARACCAGVVEAGLARGVLGVDA